MDFKSATDRLKGCVTHEEVADVLGVDVQRIRQARLSEDSAGYRPPPEGWTEAVATLAAERGGDLQDLARELREAG